MDSRIVYFLLIVQISVIAVLSTASALSDETEMTRLKGNIVCTEVDKNGTIKPKEDFTECDGLLVFVGMDKKIYALTGTENDLNKLIAKPKSRMGYTPPLKIRGNVEGNQRAWILYAYDTKPEKPESVKEKTITGTVVCLIPDYYRGDVKPFVSVAPCNEYEPHMHVIYNSAGEIYVLVGTEDRIAVIEKSSGRENVTLKGFRPGNEKGKILVLN